MFPISFYLWYFLFLINLAFKSYYILVSQHSHASHMRRTQSSGRTLKKLEKKLNFRKKLKNIFSSVAHSVAKC